MPKDKDPNQDLNQDLEDFDFELENLVVDSRLDKEKPFKSGLEDLEADYPNHQGIFADLDDDYQDPTFDLEEDLLEMDMALSLDKKNPSKTKELLKEEENLRELPPLGVKNENPTRLSLVPPPEKAPEDPKIERLPCKEVNPDNQALAKLIRQIMVEVLEEKLPQLIKEALKETNN